MARITLDELEKRYTPRTVGQLASDDGSMVADADIVALAIDESEALMHGLLRPGYPDDEGRQILMEADPALRGLWCKLVIAWLGTRPQTLGGGTDAGPYAALGAAAEKTIKEIAAATRRTREEGKTTGTAPNAHLATEVTQVPQGGSFVFLNSSRSPARRGGF